EKGGGAWRQRPALTAAAAAVRQAGRTDDEAALRDAVLLTRASDFLPPGRQTRPAEGLLMEANLAAYQSARPAP
ncbi:DUF1403 family protein, partial [Mesorhizobium sp.]